MCIISQRHIYSNTYSTSMESFKPLYYYGTKDIRSHTQLYATFCYLFTGLQTHRHTKELYWLQHGIASGFAPRRVRSTTVVALVFFTSATSGYMFLLA